MLLHPVNHLAALFHGTDVLAVDGLAAQDGVDAEGHCARLGIVEDDVYLAQLRVGIDVFPATDLTAKNAAEVVHCDAGVRIGIVDDDGQTIVGQGNDTRRKLAGFQAFHLTLRELACGKGEPRLELHQFVDGLFLIGVDGLQLALCMKRTIDSHLLVEDGVEALVGIESLGCCLIVIRQRFRLVPTSEEQA